MIRHAVPHKGRHQRVALHQAGLGHPPQNAQDLAAHIFVVGPLPVGDGFLAQCPLRIRPRLAGPRPTAPRVAHELGQERQPIHREAFRGLGVHDLAHDAQPERPLAGRQIQGPHLPFGLDQVAHQEPRLKHAGHILVALDKTGPLEPRDRRPHLGVRGGIGHVDVHVHVFVAEDFAGGDHHFVLAAAHRPAHPPQDLGDVAP